MNGVTEVPAWLAGIEPFLRFALLCLVAFWVIVGGFVVGAQFSDTTRHIIGYAGTTAMVLAQFYSLRKRWPALSRFGSLKDWLQRHKVLALLGSAIVVVHAGSGQMPRGLAMLAILLMLVTALSGVVGHFIHARALKARSELRAELKKQGMSDAQVEEELFMLSFSEAAFREWKRIHHPITNAFFAVTLIHILSMLFFGGVVTRG